MNYNMFTTAGNYIVLKVRTWVDNILKIRDFFSEPPQLQSD